jgi:hypothetical protein
MKKETLDKAKELEDQIEDYQLISHIMSYPYQRYKLFRRKPCIQHEGGTSTGIVITDRELAKLIETYCREKVKTSKQELEEL